MTCSQLRGAQSVTLAWDPNSETNLAGYSLYFGMSSRNYSTRIDVGPSTTTATASNLLDGQTYYFAVTARNTLSMESGYSDEVSYSVPEIPNTPPVANNGAFQVSEDQSVAAPLTGSDADGHPLTFLIVTQPANGQIIGAAPNVTYRPNTNFFGADSFTFRVNDGRDNSALATVAITVNAVNDAPTLNALADLTITEDAPNQTVNLAGIGMGAANEGQTLVVSATSSNPALIPAPVITYSSPVATGALVFTPVANAAGSSVITVTVDDGQAQNNLVSRAFTVTVTGVNDAPTFAPISDLTVSEDAGPQVINVTGIGSGAANESQSLTLTASSSNPTLIPNPAVTYASPSSTAVLTLQAATNASGSSTITVTLNDGQGQNNTLVRTFRVTVNAANDAPSITDVPNQTINENGNTANLGFTIGDSDTPLSSLTLTRSSSNPTLLPVTGIALGGSGASRTVRLTPAANQSGTAVVTITVSDGAGGSASDTILLTVNSINQSPALGSIANLTVAEDAATQTVALSGIDSGDPGENQTLTVTAISGNPALIPNPTVNYASPNASGSLNFAPQPNASGSATITVTVSDGQAQNNTVSRQFTVTVTAVNDAPTLNAISDVTLSEDSGAQTVNLAGIGTGAANETQPLSLTATSSNPALIPNPIVTYSSPNSTGTLRIQPVANASGSATITVTVNDGQAQNNARVETFTITVLAVNDPPTLNALASLTINKNAGLQTVNLSGISDGATNETQTLTLTATSSNPALIPDPVVSYTNPNATGSLAFTPVLDAVGAANITVTLNDGGGENFSVTRTFSVTVNQVNSPPTLDPIQDLTLNEDAPPQVVNLTGIGSGAANETQTLVVTASSSNPTLVPNPTVIYTSLDSTGALTIRTATNATGLATITVTVNDGQSQNNTISRNFTVSVTGVNDPPTISNLADQSVNENSSTANLPFSIGDNETAAGVLALAATSSNPTLLPVAGITFGGTGANRTVRLTPAANQNGSSVVTITVTDGSGGSAADTFTLTVNPVNEAPTLGAIGSIIVAEDADAQTIPLAGISSGDPGDNQVITITATSSNPSLVPNPTVNYSSPSATGSLLLHPEPNASGSVTITVTVNDGQAQNNTATRTFTVTVTAVNDAPVFNPVPDLTFNEDSGALTINLAGINAGASDESQALTLTAVSDNPSLLPNPVVNYSSPNATGSLTFQPAANASGVATVTITLSDGQSQNNLASQTVLVTILPVNDPPTLNAIADVTANKNSGAQTITLTGITSGATNEVESLTVTAVSGNPSVIPHPTVNYGGSGGTATLTFTPAQDAIGTAVITVAVDDGQTQNATTSRTFAITISQGNSAPTLDTIADVTVAEDAQGQPVVLTGVSSGAADEVQTLVVSASSSNPSLLPNPVVSYTSPNSVGTLSLTPAPNATGSATITVTVNDGQGQNNTVVRTFVATVTEVNDPPALTDIPDRTVTQNVSSGPIPFRVTDADTPLNNITFGVASSNPTLVPVANVTFGGSGANRSVTAAPAADRSGSAVITVTADDGAGGSSSDTFTLTVSAVNSPPTLGPISPVTIPEDAAEQTVTLFGISPGASEENQPVTVSASSSNPSLIPNPSVEYTSPNQTAILRFTPSANVSGSATITVRIEDGQAQNNAVTRTFVVTVTAVNDPPVVSDIPDQRVEPGFSTPAIPFTISDVETAAASLRVTVTSSDLSVLPAANIILGGATSNRTVQLRGAAGVIGTSTVSIAVSDNVLTTTRQFKFAAAPGNTAPTVSIIANQVTDNYTDLPPVPFTVNDAESDPASLVVTASSFDQTVLPNTNIFLVGTGANRTIAIKPIATEPGIATVALTVSDGRLSARTSFQITINYTNPPTDVLLLQTEGTGTVSPNLGGQELILGRVYSMSASPGSGQVFAGWSGSVTSSSMTVSFQMRSNTALHARFVANPYIPLKGSYNGLFNESDEVRLASSGSFTLVTTDRGTFSGKLMMIGKSYSFKGTLDLRGTASVTVPRTGLSPLSMSLEIGAGGNLERVIGHVTDGIWFAELLGDKAVYNSKTNPAPHAGNYTFVVPGRIGEAFSPEGDGYATVKIDGNGLASFTGSLADGTKVSQRVAISRQGQWPMYVSLYKGGGSIVSWLNVTNRATDDISGLMSWIKLPSSTAKYYPGGFANDTYGVGSRFTPPAPGSKVLNLSDGNLLFSKGNLSADFANQVSLGADNKFANRSQNKLTLLISPATGLLSGTVIDPSTGASLRFSGAALQKQNAAFGFLLGTDRSSQVVLFE